MTVKQYTLSQITAELGGEVRGEDISVCAVRPLAQAGVEHISFLANPKYKHEVHDSKAGRSHRIRQGRRRIYPAAA